MHCDQQFSFLFCCDGMLNPWRQDQHLSGSKLMYLAGGGDFHAASQDVHVDNPVGLVGRQTGESIEGEESDGVTAMTIQGLLPMAALASTGFGSEFADHRFQINRAECDHAGA